MRWKSILRACLLPLFLVSFGCAEDDPSPLDPGTVEYAGRQACATCHAGIVERWEQSGHAHMVTPVVNGQKPTRPGLELPDDLTPAGLQWSDVSYVLGGFGWKALFLGEDGSIHTGATALYRLQPRIGQEEWGPYAEGSSSVAYDCGGCHTTGWQSVAENGGEHQGGLTGIAGTWVEDGVACEACHGPANQHVRTRGRPAFVTREERCGECHSHHDPQGVRATEDGFVESEGQADEMALAGHSVLECSDCHDPHSGVRQDVPSGSGIVAQCESCHAQEAAIVRHPGGVTPECIDCHMPHATRSAVELNAYHADVRTHIFDIRRTPESKQAMFESVGDRSYVREGGITLDFACYTCHRDANGIGGGQAPILTVEQLAGWAPVVHSAARGGEGQP